MKIRLTSFFHTCHVFMLNYRVGLIMSTCKILSKKVSMNKETHVLVSIWSLVLYVQNVMISEQMSGEGSSDCVLTLWMLGNFLKIDYIVVCFLKYINSACFKLGMINWVANRLDLRPAAEWLAWTRPVCISINVVPALKGLQKHIITNYKIIYLVHVYYGK